MDAYIELSKPTSFFGIKLWIVTVAALVAFFAFLAFIIRLCIILRRRKKSKLVSYVNDHKRFNDLSWEVNMTKQHNHDHLQDVVAPMGFTLREVEIATVGFAKENVLRYGDHGVLYYGLLEDDTPVVVKSLPPSCDAEDFKTEAELIGKAKHKNLASLLGYCKEGCYRLLVNEYVFYGDLHQWLHGLEEETAFSPLTWDIRMKIIQGVAKGLAYLHEDVGQMTIVHGYLKSSNVLLDQHWNPKISDFGISRLFGPGLSHPQGNSMSGYLDGTFSINEDMIKKSDVYSFGILIMEIVTGRVPVIQDQPKLYLIDWLKTMVANWKLMGTLDPKLLDKPTTKELKRILLIAFRCTDPDAEHRPTMADVIHMLEPRNLLLSIDDCSFRKRASLPENDKQIHS